MPNSQSLSSFQAKLAKYQLKRNLQNESNSQEYITKEFHIFNTVISYGSINGGDFGHLCFLKRSAND